MEYIVTRSKRKTVAIYITRDATVEVRAPLKTAKSVLDKFVLSKEDWIKKHLSQRALLLAERTEFSLNYGSLVLYRGAEYPLVPRAGRRFGFDGGCFFLPENLSCDGIKSVVIKIYKALAGQLLLEKSNYYAKQMGVLPTAVKITSAKTRWGSCSGKNSVNFSWRLVLAEDSVIDYVVVHELAHILEHNHSGRFWAVVERVLPDYALRERGLRVLQERLSREDWG